MCKMQSAKVGLWKYTSKLESLKFFWNNHIAKLTNFSQNFIFNAYISATIIDSLKISKLLEISENLESCVRLRILGHHSKSQDIKI